jgi:uncharacterized RDD family membrane protein YckC
VTQLVTGEAVALELRPAAVPSRILAGILDALAQLVLLFGVLALLGAVSGTVSSAGQAALFIVLLVLVTIGYPVGFEALLRGRTPGKMALGLRVVRDDGGPIGFRQALVRGLAGAFIERPGITFFSLGIVSIAVSSQSKRVGDFLAGTLVLQERVAVRGGQVAMMPPQLAGWAAGCDLSGVSDDLALSTRQFLARSADLTAAAREELGGRLLAAVAAAIAPPPPPGTPGWAVLSAVLAERRRREQLRLGTTAAGMPSYVAAPPSYGPSSFAPSSFGPPSYAPPSSPPPSSPPLPSPPPSSPPPASPPLASPTTRDPAPPDPGPGGFVVPS